jgi:hypothetical protein
MKNHSALLYLLGKYRLDSIEFYPDYVEALFFNCNDFQHRIAAEKLGYKVFYNDFHWIQFRFVDRSI